MKTSSFAAALAGTLWATLIVLPFLRIIQVHRELFLEKGTNPGWQEVLWPAMMRRLDDPSFWASLAAALAGTLIFRAVCWLEAETNDGQVSVNPVSWVWSGCVAASAFSFYLLGVYFRPGTFFFQITARAGAESKPTKFDDSLIIGLQTFEGVLVSVLILAACLLVPIGMTAVDALRERRNAAAGRKARGKPEKLVKQSAWLLDASVKPVTILLLLITWNVTADFFDKKSFLPWGPVKGLAGMGALLWPFGILTYHSFSKLYAGGDFTVEAYRAEWFSIGKAGVLDIISKFVRKLPLFPIMVIVPDKKSDGAA